MYDLIIFDMDGTLIQRNMPELTFLDGVAEWFKSLSETNHPKIAIATNQGGVGLRYWMEIDGFGNPQNYPKANQVINQLLDLKVALKEFSGFDLPVDLQFCFAYQSKKTEKWSPVPPDETILDRWNPNYRKPNCGMLVQARHNAEVGKDRVLYVGDREEDLQAAERAGIDFMWAHEFFGG